MKSSQHELENVHCIETTPRGAPPPHLQFGQLDKPHADVMTMCQQKAIKLRTQDSQSHSSLECHHF